MHARRPCYKRLSSFLISQDFKKGKIDITLSEGEKDNLIIVEGYVNDFVF